MNHHVLLLNDGRVMELARVMANYYRAEYHLELMLVLSTDDVRLARSMETLAEPAPLDPSLVEDGLTVEHQPAGDPERDGTLVATKAVQPVAQDWARVCDHCKLPLPDGSHKSTKYCKRKECVHERWRIQSASRQAAKKADEKVDRLPVAQARAKKESPKYVVQDGFERGDKISSEELGMRLRSKRIEVGTRLLHPVRGMFRVVAKPNGSLGMVSDGKAAK
jgi:hypothetical protein